MLLCSDFCLKLCGFVLGGVLMYTQYILCARVAYYCTEKKTVCEGWKGSVVRQPW